MKKPDRILQDILAATGTHTVSRVDFVHDMFTANRKIIEEVCNYFIVQEMKVFCLSWNPTIALFE